MIARTLSAPARRLASQYPVVTLTGPRQSGKTTLCRAVFADKPYVNLEDPDVRARAKEDPRGLLDSLPDGAVFDEIQRAPELTSYLQAIVDQRDEPGMFILTGSHQFEVIEGVSQSLAGRTALLTLLPFSYDEVYGSERVDLSTVLLTGFYPRIHDKHLDPSEALGYYVRTYLERDLRNISVIRSLDTFERFLRLCAAWSGQLLNMAAIAGDLGVDNKTVKAWLSLLQASYIVFLVEPHHENLRKRIRKSPKLYFYDVGLCAYLLGIREPAQIDVHPLRGALFETFIVAELVKQRLHRARDRDLFFFRDHVGNEVDVLIDQATRVIPVEIKASATFGPALLDGLRYYGRLREVETTYLVYGGTDAFEVSGAHVVPFHRLHELMPAVRL